MTPRRPVASQRAMAGLRVGLGRFRELQEARLVAHMYHTQTRLMGLP